MEEIQAVPEVTQPQAVATEEKLLPQSEVNKLVGRAKAEAEAKATKLAEAEYLRKLEEIQKSQQQANSQAPRDSNADAIYQQVQERFNQEMMQRQMQEQMSNIVRNYDSKIASAKTSYSDFDDVTKAFSPGAFPQLVYLVSGIENGGDIIYEIAKNPSKLVTLDALAQRNPELAHVELMKLSKSISDNKLAQQELSGNAQAPLDRLQPSRITTGSNGKMSIADLKNQSWLRG
jgi:hypothetical protein